MNLCLIVIGACYGLWAVSIILNRRKRRIFEWRRGDWAINERLERLREIQKK